MGRPTWIPYRRVVLPPEILGFASGVVIVENHHRNELFVHVDELSIFKDHLAIRTHAQPISKYGHDMAVVANLGPDLLSGWLTGVLRELRNKYYFLSWVHICT